MSQSDYKFQPMLQRLPLIVQLADPGQNMVQDLMEEVPVHADADVVHVVTSTLLVQLLEERVILPDHGPPGQTWLHPGFYIQVSTTAASYTTIGPTTGHPLE